MTEETMGEDSPGSVPEEPRDEESRTADAGEKASAEESRASGATGEHSDEQQDETEPATDSAHWATRLREFVDEAARIAREDLADKEITFEDTTKRAEELIRKQPLAAVGVAAGVGLLAGILFNRRR